MWEPKTTRIKIEDNLTANLPSDYMSWVKIGVFNGYGEIATLTVNNNLSTYKDLSSNRLTDIAADTPNPLGLISSPYYYNFYDNGSYTHLFGIQSGLITPGECRVDDKNGVILFNPGFSYSEIVLEYISSPEQDDDYTIDIKFQEPMISWLRWMEVASSKNVGLGEKQMRRKMYYNDLSRAKKYQKPFRLQEVEQGSRINSNLKLKA